MSAKSPSLVKSSGGRDMLRQIWAEPGGTRGGGGAKAEEEEVKGRPYKCDGLIITSVGRVTDDVIGVGDEGTSPEED